MVLFQRVVLPSLLIILAFSSCSIQNRRYAKGFNVEWNSTSDNKTQQLSNPQKLEGKILVVAEVLHDNLLPVITQEKAIQGSNSFATQLSIDTPDNGFEVEDSTVKCDKIHVKNGAEIAATVIEITSGEIKYKKCPDFGGPVYVIDKRTVSTIKYSNGTKDEFNADNSGSSGSGEKHEKRMEGYAIGSLILGVAGIAAPYLLGPLAIIFGVKALKGSLKNRTLAIVGICLGIFDVAIIALYVFLLFFN